MKRKNKIIWITLTCITLSILVYIPINIEVKKKQIIQVIKSQTQWESSVPITPENIYQTTWINEKIVYRSTESKLFSKEGNLPESLISEFTNFDVVLSDRKSLQVYDQGQYERFIEAYKKNASLWIIYWKGHPFLPVKAYESSSNTI